MPACKAPLPLLNYIQSKQSDNPHLTKSRFSAFYRGDSVSQSLTNVARIDALPGALAPRSVKRLSQGFMAQLPKFKHVVHGFGDGQGKAVSMAVASVV